VVAFEGERVMALSMATMRKHLLPQLNQLFDVEYKKYSFRNASEMAKNKDLRATESEEHKQLRRADTQVLRDLWTAAFNGEPASMDEVANMSGTDLWVVGSELYERKELREGNRPEFSEEVYLLKPHANS
jgi:hypothetical protein